MARDVVIHAWMHDVLLAQPITPLRQNCAARKRESPASAARTAKRRRILGPIDPNADTMDEARRSRRGRRASPRKKGTMRATEGPKSELELDDKQEVLAQRPYIQALVSFTPVVASSEVLSLGSSSAPRSKRFTSPVKSLMDLQLSDIGMRYESFSVLQDAGAALDNNAHRLFEALVGAEAGKGVVHPALRTEFERRVDGRRKWLDLLCADEDDQGLDLLVQPQ